MQFSLVPAWGPGSNRTPPVPPAEDNWTSTRVPLQKRIWPWVRLCPWPMSWPRPASPATSSEPAVASIITLTTTSLLLATVTTSITITIVTVTTIATTITIMKQQWRTMLEALDAMRFGLSQHRPMFSISMGQDSSAGFLRYLLKFPIQLYLQRSRRPW